MDRALCLQQVVDRVLAVRETVLGLHDAHHVHAGHVVADHAAMRESERGHAEGDEEETAHEEAGRRTKTIREMHFWSSGHNGGPAGRRSPVGTHAIPSLIL